MADIIPSLVEVPFAELVEKLVAVIPKAQTSLNAASQAGPSGAYIKEAVVEAKLAFSTKKATDFIAGGEVKGGFGLWSVSINASYTRKYEFSGEMASSFKLTVVGIPPETEKPS